MPEPHDLPEIVTPDADDDEGTPQGERWQWLPWSKPKIPTRPTLSERLQFKRAHRKGDG